MQLKFMRIEFKNKTMDGHRINIRVANRDTQRAIKVHRKVRNKVANFFGEMLEIDQLGEQPRIIIQDCDSNAQKGGLVQLFTISLTQICEQQSISKGRSMQSQSSDFRIYWWCQKSGHTLSRNSSSISMDLGNIDTPTCELDNIQDRIYSPLIRFKKFDLIEQENDALSIQGDSSPKTYFKSRNSRSNRKLSPFVLHEVKNIKSEKTCTDTRTKSNKKEIKTLKTTNIVPKDNKKTPFDKKKRNRSYSHAAVNLADAIIYTTVGALCGLAAGMSF